MGQNFDRESFDEFDKWLIFAINLNEAYNQLVKKNFSLAKINDLSTRQNFAPSKFCTVRSNTYMVRSLVHTCNYTIKYCQYACGKCISYA